MGWSREVIARVVGAVLPGRCPGCGRAAEPVCATCAAGLRQASQLAAPPLVDQWVAVFAYEGVAREVVARLKYRNERAALPWLASTMAAAFVAALPGERPDVVTWAPASAQRRRATGFDHGELLARAVATCLGLPVVGLIAREAGSSQTGKTRADRAPGPPLRPSPSAGRAVGRSVLLVDDVVTTGATLTAAATALRRAGARRVVALTAAATPPPGRRALRPAYTPQDDRCGRGLLTASE
jgi:ComF family protein